MTAARCATRARTVHGATRAPRRAPRLRHIVLACLALGVSNTSSAENPVGFAYVSTTNIGAFSAPTGMLVAGKCTRDLPAFATARNAGAEVLGYLNAVDIPPDNHTSCTGSQDQDFYMGDVDSVPRWGLDSVGEWRVNWRHSDGTPNYIANIRKDSAWANYVVKFIEQLMVENRIDGVFLDVLGARLWSTQKPYDTDGDGQLDTVLPLARWDEWPQSERDDWTNGAVDLARRLDASRRRLNPDFLIVNNNIWFETTPKDSRLGPVGEQYVDGVCLENPSSDPELGTFHANYAGRVFGNLGHRRVLVIKTTHPDIAAQWATIPGVTHVTGQTNYLSPGTPAVGFQPLNDRQRPRTLGNTAHAGGTHLLTFNIKRASRFSFAQGGRVLRFGAYLDGQGESSGSMPVRVVLYTNNVDRPGNVVVQSADVTVNFGQAAGWVNFPVTSNVSIPPGDYWLAIHGGATGGKGRDYTDGPDNCYSKGDPFDDGTSSWGSTTGTACTGTLSVYAMVAN